MKCRLLVLICFLVLVASCTPTTQQPATPVTATPETVAIMPTATEAPAQTATNTLKPTETPASTTANTAKPTATPVSRSTNTPEPRATYTPAPTETPTPIPAIRVGALTLPDPHFTYPKLFDLRRADAPIPQFVNAMKMAGVEVSPEQVADGAAYELLTGAAGNPVVAFVYTIPEGQPLPGDYPLSIAKLDKDATKAVWQEVTLSILGNLAQLPEGVAFGHTEVNGMYDVYAKEFSIAVLIHDFGWLSVEPQEGVVKFKNQPNWARADEYMNFVLSHGMRIMTGFPFFTEQYPDWFVRGDFASVDTSNLPGWVDQSKFTPTQLAYLSKCIKHIDDVTTYVRTKIATYNSQHPSAKILPPIVPVVNEFVPLSWGRDDVLQRVFPDLDSQRQLLAILYRATREAYPEAYLIYNEAFNDRWDSPGMRNTLSIVDHLSELGLIDGVGMQFHVDASNHGTKEEWIRVMRLYADTLKKNRVEDPFVIITEKDVSLWKTPGTNQQRYKEQAQIVDDIVRACDESGVCRAILNFQVGDPYSWLEESTTAPASGPKADPTLFAYEGGRFKRKPAYYTEAQALFERLRRMHQ